jgi:hypothetical protein
MSSGHHLLSLLLKITSVVGVEDVEDSRFEETWAKVYLSSIRGYDSLNVLWYLVAGITVVGRVKMIRR